MNTRTQFIIITGIIVLILGVAWYTFPERKQISPATFPATIQRDCAPWDGSAFTLTVPLQDEDAIVVSIWQAPEINLAKAFSFPDTTGQVGNASLMHSGSLPEQLSGKVFFSSVKEGNSTEGRFELSTESDQHFVGEFRAVWSDQIVLCG